MYLQRILLQIRLACQGEKRRDRFVNEAIKGALLHLLSAYFFFLCAINFFPTRRNSKTKDDLEKSSDSEHGSWNRIQKV